MRELFSTTESTPTTIEVNPASALHRLAARFGRRDDSLKTLWIAYAFLGILFVVFLVAVLVRPNGTYWTWLDGWGVDVFEVVLSFMCLARALSRRPGRAVALTLGVGLLCWTVGDIFLTIESLGGAAPPSPSVADIFYLLFYPFTYVAVILLMRRELKRISPPSWLDGGVAGLGAATLCAAFAFHSIVHTAGGSALSVATNLAYPIGDVLLLSVVVGATSLLSGRGKLPWALMGSGIALNVVGDTSNLFGSSFGGGRVGSTFNAVAWPAAILVMSMAVWVNRRPPKRLVAEKTSGFLLPGIACGVGLGVLFVATFHRLGRVAIGFATATLALAGIRLALSARGLRSITEERHRQAVTDELTGLGNRRKLFNVFENFSRTGILPPRLRRASPFCSWTSITSRRSTTLSGTLPATSCCGSSVRGSRRSVRGNGRRRPARRRRVRGPSHRSRCRRGEERRGTADREHREAFRPGHGRARGSARASGSRSLRTDAEDSAGLLRCADVAMFRAKAGNSAFAFYDESLDDENVLLMAEELRVAVEEKQFVLHYQPQLDLHTGEISAVEALLRWPNKRLGMVPPLKFLPVAEEAGLMPALTELVLESALAQCAAWRAESHDVAVSVNLSASNLLDPGFTELVRSGCSSGTASRLRRSCSRSPRPASSLTTTGRGASSRTSATWVWSCQSTTSGPASPLSHTWETWPWGS